MLFPCHNYDSTLVPLKRPLWNGREMGLAPTLVRTYMGGTIEPH